MIRKKAVQFSYTIESISVKGLVWYKMNYNSSIVVSVCRLSGGTSSVKGATAGTDGGCRKCGVGNGEEVEGDGAVSYSVP